MNLTRHGALAAAATLLLLAGCSGSDEPDATPSDSSSTSTGGSTGEEAPVVTLDVIIEGDSVTPIAETLEAAPGDTIALHIVTDRPGELHVHSSPEQEVAFDEGESTVTFVVDKPGAVDVEEHESDALIAKVLVE